MHSLIITAHPSSLGFTHRIAEAYLRTRKAKGDTAEIMDLYAAPWKKDYLIFQDQDELSMRGKELSTAQQMIKQADELVFVFPIWWYDVPAILKNFLDSNFSAGFAFEFTSKGIKGLLTGKTVRFFSTSGAPGLLYRFGLMKYAPTFRISMKNCGMKIVSKTFFGGRMKPDASKEKLWLQQVEDIAQR